MIEILWDACVSTFKFLRGRPPNRKVWFKQERWWPVCLAVDLRSAHLFRPRGKIGRLTTGGETSFRRGPTFPPSWRIYFTAVSDTLIPGSFRGALRFASTDFRIVQCFEFQRCFFGSPTGGLVRVTVRRTGRDTGSDRSVVKASKSLNVVPLSRLKLRGRPRFINSRIKDSGNFLPKDWNASLWQTLFFCNCNICNRN